MTLRSMTAFGRAALITPLGRFTIELHSLNRKHLELSTNLPLELQCFESDIKKWVSSAVSRGQLTLKLSVIYEGSAPLNVKPNLPYVIQLNAAWEAIAKNLGLEMEDRLKLEILAASEGVILYENEAFDNEALKTALHNVVNMALEKLVVMKALEGTALTQDLLHRLEKLAVWIDLVAEKAPAALEQYREKLKIRLKELLSGMLDNNDRILREVSIYADRTDISEEIARFKSHLIQFHQLLESPLWDVGKTLDFIVQELKRETNTIGAKSLDLETMQIVIDIKTEVERIREQLQNIE